MQAYGTLDVKWAKGFKGDRLSHVDRDMVCFSCGNSIKFVNVVTGAESVFQPPGGAVCQVTSSSHHRMFAVAEEGLNPIITIYNFPSCEVVCALEAGALLGYSQLQFSFNGSFFAATSSIPDFSIFVWDWQTGKLKCHEKLPGESPVTSLLFNPLNKREISTISETHVSIWTLEECNEISTMKSKVVNLPTTDGVILSNGEDLASRSGTRQGFNVHLPTSTRAGLVGGNADKFEPPELRRPRVIPSSQCWSSRGEIYVGCVGGQLFRVDGASGNPALLLGGISGEIECGMFHSISLNSEGLVAGGDDGTLRLIQLDNNGVKITELHKGMQPITCLSFAPPLYVDLVLSTSSGEIQHYSLVERECGPIITTRTGDFVGAGFTCAGKLAVTCREDGELQIWSCEDGSLVASFSLCTRTCSLSCCPSSPVVAIGTWTGHVCYIDTSSLLSEEINLRQVGSTRIHHSPVTYLKYNAGGDFLLTASEDEPHIFIIDAKPSSGFQCIGYLTRHSLSVSVDSAIVTTIGDNIEIAALSSETKSGARSEVTMTPTPTPQSDATWLDARSLLAVKEENAKYDEVKRDLSRSLKGFTSSCSVTNYPTTSVSSEENPQGPTPIHPVSEHYGHQLSGGSVILSPHGKWVASFAPDGDVIVRDVSNWDSITRFQPHSYIHGGVKTLTFSPDASHFISVGYSDQACMCYQWNFTSKGQSAGNNAVEYARVLNMRLRSVMDVEGDVLAAMEEWSPSTTTGHNVNNLRESKSGARSEVTMTPTPTPQSDATWLDARTLLAVKEENAKYDEVKRDLRKNIKELRKTILGMMENNNSLPDLEQLRHDEYNLDTDEQSKMQEQQDQRVQEIREEIEFENLAQRYLAYLITKQCWDDMVTKGRSLKGFTSSCSVTNYPTTSVSSEENAILNKVSRMRKIEMALNTVQKSIVETGTKQGGDEDEEEEKVGLSLHGSLGPNYSGGNEMFYSQFDLHTREEKITQIILVKDAIRRIKSSFNEAFTNIFRNKEQEITRTMERNVRIREIMKELDLDADSVKDPQMDVDEKPEKVFIVTDDEVTVERVLSKEQQKEKEEQERVEQERKEAAKQDNKRERALTDMMGGVLEVKKEDALKQDIPTPDFMDEKLEKDWTDEEKKKAKEHQKKLKDLQEEREKYRKNLENELKKLQQNNLDAITNYDESLQQLFNRKVKTEMVVNQEELKILRMTQAIMVADELATHEDQLNKLLELKNKFKASSSSRLEDIQMLVKDYEEINDSTIAEDKMLDRAFKRDFSDVPLSISDQLYKLFKRRPRQQKPRTLAERSNSLDPYGVSDFSAEVTIFSTQDGLAELDSEVNIPEGVDSALWERLCNARRNKVESESNVKQSVTTLADMMKYLHHRQNEDEVLEHSIDDVIKQQTKLCEDSMKNMLNLEVQFLLKQGQVEINCGPFISDYSDSILIHRGVVEDLNGTIRTLGESKVAAMTESKDFKKGIHQLEWERKRMVMQMEDLHNRARHIQMLKLTKDLQAFLNEENNAAKQSQQVAVLEQTLALQDKQLQKNISHKSKLHRDLERTIRLKEQENHQLDRVLEELHVSVSERKNIADVNAGERAKNTADKRLKGIVQRRKLVDLAKAQAQEVAVLRAEVERLRMKTFPALVQV
uniref:Cilia- and flagella-associated protein 43 n=1 Tax=Ciona intestinalis TaxID=7719 RepID=F6U441_CIOIN